MTFYHISYDKIELKILSVDLSKIGNYKEFQKGNLVSLTGIWYQFYFIAENSMKSSRIKLDLTWRLCIERRRHVVNTTFLCNKRFLQLALLVQHKMAPFSPWENSLFETNLLLPWLFVSFLALELPKLDFSPLFCASSAPFPWKTRPWGCTWLKYFVAHRLTVSSPPFCDCSKYTL